MSLSKVLKMFIAGVLMFAITACSDDSNTFPVENYFGATTLQARDFLEEASGGRANMELVDMNSDREPEISDNWIVCETDPLAGKTAKYGSTVTFKVVKSVEVCPNDEEADPLLKGKIAQEGVVPEIVPGETTNMEVIETLRSPENGDIDNMIPLSPLLLNAKDMGYFEGADEGIEGIICWSDPAPGSRIAVGEIDFTLYSVPLGETCPPTPVDIVEE